MSENSFISPPFTKQDELVTVELASELDIQDVHREGAQSPADATRAFLRQELDPHTLNMIHARLWLVAKRSGSHIDALHIQLIKCRNIVIAEDPGLHLTWYYDRIYIKPLPRYLLNYDLWETHLFPMPRGPSTSPNFEISALSPICKNALGYLRSYSFLIQHDSDFHIAQRSNLIPQDITYQKFRAFIRPFKSIPDSAVAPRYMYGQLRLSRLNYAVRILQPSSMGGKIVIYYQERYWQTGQYIRRFRTPLLFVFAALSLILSAMQVGIAASSLGTREAFTQASWGFSVAVIMFIFILGVLCVLGILGLLLLQLSFALQFRPN